VLSTGFGSEGAAASWRPAAATVLIVGAERPHYDDADFLTPWMWCRFYIGIGYLNLISACRAE